MISANGISQAKERFDKIIKDKYSNIESISFNSLINAYINDINENIHKYGEELKWIDRTNANISKLIIACFPNSYSIDNNRNYTLHLK